MRYRSNVGGGPGVVVGIFEVMWVPVVGIFEASFPDGEREGLVTGIVVSPMSPHVNALRELK